MHNEWNLTKCISDNPKVGKVWLVYNKENPSITGFFKHDTNSSKKYSGNVAVNEYLAYLIGKELSLPVASLLQSEINGIKGVISLKKVNQKILYNWNHIKNKQNPFRKIINPDLLIKMFIFDIFIVNIDRNNRNIVLYKSDKKELYDFYLIDHGLSLLGAFKWKKKSPVAEYWDDVDHYNNRYLKHLPNYLLRNKKMLMHYTKEIMTLDNDRITNLINEQPHDILDDRSKERLNEFLIKRKSNLNKIVKKWIQSRTKK